MVLRRRGRSLLGQPYGFEGLLPGEVLADLDDLPVPDRGHLSQRLLEGHAAACASPAIPSRNAFAGT